MSGKNNKKNGISVKKSIWANEKSPREKRVKIKNGDEVERKEGLQKAEVIDNNLREKNYLLSFETGFEKDIDMEVCLGYEIFNYENLMSFLEDWENDTDEIPDMIIKKFEFHAKPYLKSENNEKNFDLNDLQKYSQSKMSRFLADMGVKVNLEIGDVRLKVHQCKKQEEMLDEFKKISSNVNSGLDNLEKRVENFSGKISGAEKRFEKDLNESMDKLTRVISELKDSQEDYDKNLGYVNRELNIIKNMFIESQSKKDYDEKMELLNRGYERLESLTNSSTYQLNKKNIEIEKRLHGIECVLESNENLSNEIYNMRSQELRELENAYSGKMKSFEQKIKDLQNEMNVLKKSSPSPNDVGSPEIDEMYTYAPNENLMSENVNWESFMEDVESSAYKKLADYLADMMLFTSDFDLTETPVWNEVFRASLYDCMAECKKNKTPIEEEFSNYVQSGKLVQKFNEFSEGVV